MNEELIKYKTAVLAKKKGFNFIVKNYYYPEAYNTTKPIIYDQDIIENLNSHSSNAYYTAPTQSLLQRWLREVHDIHIKIEFLFEENKYYFSIYQSDADKIKFELYCLEANIEDYVIYNTYEEALEDALYNTLNLIK